MFSYKRDNRKTKKDAVSNEKKFERSVQKVEKLKNIFEIIAISIAGFWAGYTFLLKDAANMDAEIEQTSRLKTLDWADSVRYSMEYELSIRNIGDYIFYIDSLHIDYWIFPSSVLGANGYIDYYSYIKCNSNKPTRSLSLSRSIDPNIPLINVYLKSQNHSKNFLFILDDIPKKSVAFRATSIGHYKNFLGFEHKCSAVSTIWMYDCWERTKAFRRKAYGE